jgi:hypothetical protein
MLSEADVEFGCVGAAAAASGEALPATGKEAPPAVPEWLLAGSLFLLGFP